MQAAIMAFPICGETVWGRGYVLKDPEPAEQRLQRAAMA